VLDVDRLPLDEERFFKICSADVLLLVELTTGLPVLYGAFAYTG